MIQRRGDVFKTESAFIGHGVNLHGVMGAGVARLVRENYPYAYELYKRACDEKSLELGSTQLCYSDDRGILNMATQVHPGPDARYDAVFDASMDAAVQIIEESAKIDRSPVLAIPQIGCGIGGLEWSKVQIVLEAVEILNPGFKFEVWSL